jgi:hypothetical protein
MKSFTYYASLPDSMTVDEVEAEFKELLSGLESQTVNSACFVKPIMELSERQWHTYSVLSFCVRARVEDYLLSVWDGNDLELVEDFIGIMVRLGLERINIFLRSFEEKDVPSEVFNEISLALSELGGSVSDPYSGMH